MEREIKFRLPSHRVAVARHVLESICRPDPRYPRDAVWTVYFDTPQFALLRQKIDGDCDKRKIRIRWYDSSQNVFIEIKYRYGAHRDKLRVHAATPSEIVAGCRLESRDLSDLLEQLRDAGGHLPAPLEPMMKIRFERSRFVHPVSGLRVSLDEWITVPAVNRCFFPGASVVPLPLAIIEIKGETTPRLPAALSAILGLGSVRVSVSKYLECYRCLRGRYHATL